MCREYKQSGMNYKENIEGNKKNGTTEEHNKKEVEW